MLKDGIDKKIADYVNDGGTFVATYLTGIVDKDDLCFLGGFPANGLKDVFGIWNEETDALPAGTESYAEFDGKKYRIDHICDVIHAHSAKTLGVYLDDFYAGEPCVTENSFGKGSAYYVAFRNDSGLARDVCKGIMSRLGIKPDTGITTSDGAVVRKRGKHIFVMNFSPAEATATLDREYINTLTGEKITGKLTLPLNGFAVLE